MEAALQAIPDPLWRLVSVGIVASFGLFFLAVTKSYDSHPFIIRWLLKIAGIVFLMIAFVFAFQGLPTADAEWAFVIEAILGIWLASPAPRKAA